MTSSPTPPPKNASSQRPDREQPRSQPCTRRPGSPPAQRLFPAPLGNGRATPRASSMLPSRMDARKRREMRVASSASLSSGLPAIREPVLPLPVTASRWRPGCPRAECRRASCGRRPGRGRQAAWCSGKLLGGAAGERELECPAGAAEGDAVADQPGKALLVLRDLRVTLKISVADFPAAPARTVAGFPAISGTGPPLARSARAKVSMSSSTTFGRRGCHEPAVRQYVLMSGRTYVDGRIRRATPR